MNAPLVGKRWKTLPYGAMMIAPPTAAFPAGERGRSAAATARRRGTTSAETAGRCLFCPSTSDMDCGLLQVCLLGSWRGHVEHGSGRRRCLHSPRRRRDARACRWRPWKSLKKLLPARLRAGRRSSTSNSAVKAPPATIQDRAAALIDATATLGALCQRALIAPARTDRIRESLHGQRTPPWADPRRRSQWGLNSTTTSSSRNASVANWSRAYLERRPGRLNCGIMRFISWSLIGNPEAVSACGSYELPTTHGRNDALGKDHSKKEIRAQRRPLRFVGCGVASDRGAAPAPGKDRSAAPDGHGRSVGRERLHPRNSPGWRLPPPGSSSLGAGRR